MFAARSRGTRPGPRQVVLVAILFLLSGLVPVIAPFFTSPAAATPNSTHLVSVASNGTLGNWAARGNSDISADGRYAAFASFADNLTGVTDTNGVTDLFIRDRATPNTELISLSPTGTVGNGESADPSVSADGRYVAFTSASSNLVDSDTNGTYDVFVRDRVTSKTERVSVSDNEVQGNQGGFGPRITPDGRYVAFGSDATNLLPAGQTDNNLTTDMFVRDRIAGTTRRVSINSAGTEANGQSGWGNISADGRYVTFTSWANNLAGVTDSNTNWDVFVHDIKTATTERVSLADSTGAEGNGGSQYPSLSPDGRYVTFHSGSSNIAAGDNPAMVDIFVRDRFASPARTQLINVGVGGAQANGHSTYPDISRDGRYVTYVSPANNLVANDGNNQQDIFLYDRQTNTTELVSRHASGAQGNMLSGGRASISADGRFVSFFSDATNLIDGDLNGAGDNFVRERDPQQAPLVGGAVVAAARRGGGSPSMLLDCPSPGADPCDVSTGNFSETVTDLSIPGRGMGLELTRTYNSYPSPAAPVDGPLGYGWSFNYGMSLSVVGSTVTITEENGAQIAFTQSGSTYTAPARIQATLSNTSGVWTFIRKGREVFKFNTSGQLTSAKDLNDNGTTLSYLSGKLSTVTDSAGNTLTIGWTGTRIASITDSASPARSVTFSYDGSGNLTEVVDIGGGHTQYGYDASHRMTSLREPKYFGDTTTSPSPVTTNHYDGSGRLDWQDDPLGRRTTFNYAAAPATISVTDDKGNVRVDTFTSGLLTSRTLGSGSAQAATWTYNYDPANLARTLTVDPNAAVTTTIYDSSTGNALMAIDELGRTTVSTYNGLRQPLTVRDPMGVTTTYNYNGAGNLTSEQTPLEGTASIKTTSYSIDNTTGRKGDVLSKTDPDGKVWPNTWDSAGNLATEADPLGNTTRYCYDTVGRKNKEISPKGSAAGMLCSSSNPTFTTLISTNAFGDPVVVTDPLGHQTITGYDANRNRTSQTDANGHTTTWAYDPANQLTKEIRPGTGAAGGIDVIDSTANPNAAPASTLVLDTPSGVGANHVMVAGVAVRGAVTVTAPAGWTLIRPDANGSSMKLLSYYRIATASEPTSYTWSFSSAKAAAGTITAYSGVDTANPIDIANGLSNVNDSTSIIAPSVTTSGPNERIIGLFAIMKATTITPPAGMDELGEATSSGGTEPPVTIEAADATQTADTATGPKTAVAPVADRNTGQTIALRAAATGGGGGQIEEGLSTSNPNAAPASTLVLDTPSGVGAGDVMVAGVAVRGAVTVTAPAGWTLIRPDANGSSMKLNSYYRLATDTEPANYTWSFSSAKAAAGTITAYSGVDTSNPVDAHSGYAELNNTTSIVAPSVTTTEANDRIIGLFAIMKATTITPPTGMDERGEATSSGGTEPPVTIEAADTTQATAAATGSKTATAAVADRNTGQLIALRPAPGGSSDSTTLRYVYNDDGTLWKAFNGADEATTYGYDAQARLTTVTDPLNRTTTYGYDPAGNRTTKQDPGGNCGTGSNCTTTRYDAGGQVTRIDYSDTGTPDVSLVDYDLNGRRIKMVDGTGTSTWVWDSLGRLTSNKNGNNQTVGYEYDLRGNNKKITYPGSTSVDRTFDNAGRLWKVKHWLSTTETVFTYDANSFVTNWAYPNGTMATYNPDAAGLADTIIHATTAVPPVEFARFDYDRDAAGQVTAVDSTGVPTDDRTFTYSPLGQLATDSGNPYSYDPADNITGLPSGATLAYDDANQLETMTMISGTTSYDFDTRGNRTSVTPPGGPTTNLTYDQANRLKTYGANASYAYNGDGLRMSKTVSSVTSQFTWDLAGSQPLLLGDGTIKYVYGPRGLPLAQIDGSNARYYYHDQFGSTRVVKDAGVINLATYSYDAQGNLTGSTGSITNPFRFAGKYVDSESGLIYSSSDYDDGYYDPYTGQYLSISLSDFAPRFFATHKNREREEEERRVKEYCRQTVQEPCEENAKDSYDYGIKYVCDAMRTKKLKERCYRQYAENYAKDLQQCKQDYDECVRKNRPRDRYYRYCFKVPFFGQVCPPLVLSVDKPCNRS